MEILNLFSTPVYKNNLTGKDFSVVQEEILKSLEEIILAMHGLKFGKV